MSHDVFTKASPWSISGRSGFQFASRKCVEAKAYGFQKNNRFE
jgi:hypothetical protein